MYHIIHLLKCYKSIYGLYRFRIEKSSKSVISHLFWQFHTFFHTLLNFHLYHIIRLHECYKNIYGLHRFPSENSSISAISHLFKAISHLFHTFLRKKFRPICLLIYTNILQKNQTNKMNNSRAMLQKGEKSLFFTPISPFFGQIRFFLKNRAQSLFRIHRDLTSCQKSEKINEPIFWKSSAQINKTHTCTDKGQSIGPYLQGRWAQKNL